MKVLSGAIATALCLLLSNQAMAATQYEAESAATLSGGANRNTNHTGYSGTGFVDGFFNSTTAQALFTVSSPSAGNATVTLRYSAGNGTSSNTGLYVNGTKLKNISCNTTSNWDTWANQTETVTLRAGSNTIAYKAETSSGSCINIDYISVQTAAAVTHTVTFDKNDAAATGSMGVQTIAEGATAALATNGFTKAGSSFAGWATSSTGAVVYTNGANFTMGTVNVTLYAKWSTTTLTLTITNDGHGTTSPGGSITVNAGASTQLLATPANGYQFANWTVVSGTASFASSTSASTSVTTPGGNVTISANFIATTPVGAGAVTYTEITAPVTVNAANTIVLQLPFTAPSAGHVIVSVTGLYGTLQPYTLEQRGLESFITLNSTTGGSLSGFADKPGVQNGAQYVSETAGFPVSAGANTVRLIVSPRSTLLATTYSFVKCRMTVVFSTQKM